MVINLPCSTQRRDDTPLPTRKAGAKGYRPPCSTATQTLPKYRAPRRVPKKPPLLLKIWQVFLSCTAQKQAAGPMKSKTTFQSVLDTFRKYALSERDKGDKFERLMQAYLQTDPYYAELFSHVWLWNDFPARRRVRQPALYFGCAAERDLRLSVETVEVVRGLPGLNL